MAQGDFSVNAPQIEQVWIRSRALHQHLRQLFHLAGFALDQVQREAFGRTRPDAGQFAQRG